MTSSEFRKLVKKTKDYQMLVFDATEIVACKVMLKNDPNECFVHISSSTETGDFAFFEHDSYPESKDGIDQLFRKFLDL